VLAHLSIVLAALAVARHLQNTAGFSIKKIIQAPRTQRSATIEISGQRLTLSPDLTDTVDACVTQERESDHPALNP